MKQEMENMKQQIEWLNQELQEKIHELMNSRKEKVSHNLLIYQYVDITGSQSTRHTVNLSQPKIA